jgi:NADH-quinone oxidoreductase subunit L
VNASYLWLIPAFPLLGAIITGGLALGAAQSKEGANRGFAALIAVLFPALAFAITVVGTCQLAHLPSEVVLTQTLWQWFATGTFSLGFGFLFDHLSSMMLLFITGIGSLITLYSVGYMWADRGFVRFMAYLNLFLFSMIILVLGGSLPVTFLGWEGVGLCSYLLIGFWHTNTEYNDAARKAFVVNRVGDLGFLLGAFALVGVVGSLDYVQISEWFRSTANTAQIAASVGVLSLAAILLFFGCTGKSAQIPLLTWLPDAMAGPTPVSALIHAATMVTSGVYLLARLSDLYVAAAPWVMGTILVIGCATAVFGAVAGLFQNDIKKALAYSTVSQLGYMFMACGVGAFDVGLFHVFTHAFFKATLFLGAGAIIHVLHHEQDLRKMGGLAKLAQTKGVVYFAMFWAWVAIIGLPVGAGFFSKDLILERLLGVGGLGTLVGLIALAAAALTAVYMTRVMYLAFWTPSRVDEHTGHHLASVPFTMQFPLVILGVGSIVTGILFWDELPKAFHLSPWFERFTSTTFERWLAPALETAQTAHAAVAGPGVIDHAALLWLVPLLGTAAAVFGLFVARALYGKGPTGKTVAEFPSSAPYGFGAQWTWAFDSLYAWTVVKPVKLLAFTLYWVVELALVTGFTHLFSLAVSALGGGLVGMQRSRLRSAMAMSFVGVAVILAVILWKV